eukprot:1159379-Pelagomonas_calceolata.AAC.1
MQAQPLLLYFVPFPHAGATPIKLQGMMASARDDGAAQAKHMRHPLSTLCLQHPLYEIRCTVEAHKAPDTVACTTFCDCSGALPFELQPARDDGAAQAKRTRHLGPGTYDVRDDSPKNPTSSGEYSKRKLKTYGASLCWELQTLLGTAAFVGNCSLCWELQPSH